MKLPISSKTRQPAPEPAAVAGRGDSGGVRRRCFTAPAVLPVYTQDEKRARRRGHQPIAYDADFDLAAEIEAIAAPLAARIAELPNPRGALVWVTDLVEATHEAVSVVVGWLAEVDAKRKTEHLSAEPAKRQNAIPVTGPITRSHYRSHYLDRGPPTSCRYP